MALYPPETGALLLRPPKTTKMIRLAGVTQAKAWFTTSMVFSSLRSVSQALGSDVPSALRQVAHCYCSLAGLCHWTEVITCLTRNVSELLQLKVG